jgi:regulator of replication initiation timing
MGAIKDTYDILSDMTEKAKTPGIKEEVERLRSSVSELAEENEKLIAENKILKTKVAELNTLKTAQVPYRPGRVEPGEDW